MQQRVRMSFSGTAGGQEPVGGGGDGHEMAPLLAADAADASAGNETDTESNARANSRAAPQMRHTGVSASAAQAAAQQQAILLPSSLLALATSEPSTPGGIGSASMLFGAGSLLDSPPPMTHPPGWIEGLMAWITPASPNPGGARFQLPGAALSATHATGGHTRARSAVESGRSSTDDSLTAKAEREMEALHYYGMPVSSVPSSPSSGSPASPGSAHSFFGLPSPTRASAAYAYDLPSAGGGGSSAPSLPPSRLVSCLQSTTLLTCLFFVLFLAVLVCEYYVDTAARTQRLTMLVVPESERLTLEYDILAQTESAIHRQNELNNQLRAVAERDATIHTLHAELAHRDEVVHSYRRVVHRLKALQTDHAEQDRRTREEAAAHITSATPVIDPSVDVDLAKYKEKLIRLIFGNRTIEESRRDHERMVANQAQEDDILKLVKEEVASKQSKQGGVGGLIRGGLGGPATELKVESVMRVQELENPFAGLDETQPGNKEPGPGGGAPSTKQVQAPADKLVDSDKNEYILSKPGDSSAKNVDSRLVMDLGIVIVASALGGLLASVARQPILLGYLLGGSVIGPGGLKLIGQFIQIETLAQFGATFLLFALGVEFSIGKLRKVKHIAIIGGGLQLVVMMSCVTAAGVYFGDLRMKSAVFVGAVLSMSSTTVVVKSLMERKQIATLCGQVMLGLLIVQDLFLSLMLALLNLAKVPMDRLGEEALWLLAKFCVLGGVVLVCMYLWPICLRMLDQSRSHDLFLLGLVGLCVFLTVVSEKIIHSAEVGAFLSGILISSSPGASAELTHRSLRLFGPIRDMFGALFFCSIGMLINPSFLVEKAGTIILLVLATVLLKSCITLVIVRLFGYSFEIAVRTGLGLSQVGEFAFVLASDGVGVGLISKELYFLLLGTTAVSLVITPFILNASIAIVKYLQLEDKKAHAHGVQVD